MPERWLKSFCLLITPTPACPSFVFPNIILTFYLIQKVNFNLAVKKDTTVLLCFIKQYNSYLRNTIQSTPVLTFHDGPFIYSNPKSRTCITDSALNSERNSIGSNWNKVLKSVKGIDEGNLKKTMSQRVVLEAIWKLEINFTAFSMTRQEITPPLSVMTKVKLSVWCGQCQMWTPFLQHKTQTRRWCLGPTYVPPWFSYLPIHSSQY